MTTIPGDVPSQRRRWGGRSSTDRTIEQCWASRRMRVAKAADVLHMRLRSLAWWRAVMYQYPGGVVSIPVAARMMSVTPTRIRELISEGRVPVVEGMPYGLEHDRFVPVDALFGIPTLLETGRPPGWARGPDWIEASGWSVNPWAKRLGKRVRRSDSAQNSRFAK